MIEEQSQIHWSQVGENVRARTDGKLFAGDVCPYYDYKGRLSSEVFRPQIPIDGLAVLDVGCGPGGALRGMAKKHPKRLAGCDQSPEMVRLAKQNAPEAEVVLMDGEHLPFQDRDFDVITTNTVLHHNPDHRAAALMAEICRVSSGQLFLMEDTSADMPVNRTSGVGAYGNFYGRPVGWYAAVCGMHGFDLVKIQRLKTFVSLQVFLALSSSRRINRTPRSEGSPFSKEHLAIERWTMPITKQLDKLVSNPKGAYTLMRFERRSA